MLKPSKVLKTLAAALGVAVTAAVPASPARAGAVAPVGAADPSAARRALANLPLAFEPTPGGEVRYTARGEGYAVDLAPDGAVVASGRASVRMRFAGALPAPEVTALEPAAERTSYFRGRDASRWRTGVRRYGRVHYGRVYPGVDAVFYGADRRLEYDFVVAPNADPARIRLAFDGASKLGVDADGALAISTPGGELRQQPPVAYQQTPRGRVAVPCRFVVDNGTVGFALGAYDRALPLTIDPVVAFSRVVGSAGWDEGWSVATDRDGFVYVAGRAGAPDFPATFPTAQPVYGGGEFNAFVAKYDPVTNHVVYVTFLGGSDGDDVAFGVAVDAAGDAYVTGRVSSTDFPTTPGAIATSLHSEFVYDAFVSKLSPDGEHLLYSTYLGGTDEDLAQGIAVDRSGAAYVVGNTGSTDFPATSGAWRDAYTGGFRDGFLAKIAPDGRSIVYATFVGGTGADYASGVAVDRAGRAYVTGPTYSTDFPATEGAIQTENRGNFDAFVVALKADGSDATYATYLGGAGDESLFGGAIAVDASGSAYVAGETNSFDFPVTAGVFQTSYGRGGDDGFAAKLAPDGRSLVYSTYVGGGDLDNATGIAVTASGEAVVVGTTASADFPVVAALQEHLGGGAVLASANGGDAWTGRGAGISSTIVTALAVDPRDANTIYAGTQGQGIFKTTDGGASWHAADAGLAFMIVGALAVDASGVVYAGVYDENVDNGGVFKSANGGASWQAAGASTLGAAVVGVAVSPSNPSTVYAATANTTGARSGIYRSTDGGASWSGPTLTDLGVTSVAVDPVSPTVVYGGTFRQNMFKSTDGAKTWKPSGDGLPFSVISSIAVDPTAPSTVYAGVHTFDLDGGAVFRSTDGGASWAPDSPFNFPILTLVLDPGDTRTIYAGTSKGLFRTTDGGASWSDSLLGNTNVQAFAIGETLLSGVAAGNDAFAVKLSADGSSAVYATYFGTSASDTGFGVALDAAGNVYVAGAAGAGTFAAPGSAASRFAGGDSDAFVAKIAGLTVTGAAVVNNKLVVTGDGFDARAAILVDGAVQKTRGDRRSPSTQLVSKRALSAIAPGQTVTITVRNGDGLESQPFSFTR